MTRFFLQMLCLIALLIPASRAAANAPQMDQRLYDLGGKICADIANGDLDIPQAKPFFDTVDAHGWERSEFCHCVGSEFGLNAAQKARMSTAEGEAAAEALIEILLSNMRICQPGGTIYGDLPTDKDDVWQCRQALDGRLKLPGLDPKVTLAKMKAEGRDADQVCGCAAGYLTFVEDLLGPRPLGLDLPSSAYQMQLATGISLCQQ